MNRCACSTPRDRVRPLATGGGVLRAPGDGFGAAGGVSVPREHRDKHRVAASARDRTDAVAAAARLGGATGTPP